MIILKWHTAYLKADPTQQDNRNTSNIKVDVISNTPNIRHTIMGMYGALPDYVNRNTTGMENIPS